MSDTHAGKLQHGQRYDEQDDMIVPFTEQAVNFTDLPSALGTAKTDITPHDAQSVIVRTYAPTTETLDTYVLSFPGTTNLNLPDVLESVTVTFNKTNNNGTHSTTGSGASTGTSVSLSLAIDSKSQGGASVLPDIQPVISQRWGQNVPTMNYLFYVPGNFTTDDILSRLAITIGDSVNRWPKFKPAAVTFTLKGMQVSIAADAEIQQHVSIDPSNTTATYSSGLGDSHDVGVSVRSVRIPPTIHGAITLTGTTDSSTATVGAAVSWPSGTNWPALSATHTGITSIASASVTPTSLSATSPVSSIPTSGLYLKEVVAEPWKYGYARVRCEVVDFAEV